MLDDTSVLRTLTIAVMNMTSVMIVNRLNIDIPHFTAFKLVSISENWMVATWRLIFVVFLFLQKEGTYISTAPDFYYGNYKVRNV